jgi:hypothetical protein
MSSVVLPVKRFHRIDLLPGCLLLLCLVAWGLFAAFACRSNGASSPPRILALLSVATWITTSIWLYFLNERKNGPVSKEVLLLSVLFCPLLPIAYAVLLLVKPLSEKQAVERTLSRCSSRIEDVRNGAEKMLTTRQWQAGAIESLVDAVVSGNTRAAEGLANVTESEAIDPLLALLTHDHADVRRAAVTALGRIGQPRGLAGLLSLNDDPSDSVRKAVDTALNDSSTRHVPRKSSPSVHGLGKPTDTIRHPDTAVLIGAAIAKLDRDGSENDWSAAALATFRHPGDVAQIVALLSDERSEVRRCSVDALRRIWASDPPNRGIQDGVPRLVSLLCDADETVRREVTAFLERIEEPSVVAALLMHRTEPYWEIRLDGRPLPYLVTDFLDRDVIAGRITEFTEARRIVPGESREPAWEPVAKGLAKENPRIGELFEPVSPAAAIGAGARWGAYIGAVIALGLSMLGCAALQMLGPAGWMGVWFIMAFLWMMRRQNDAEVMYRKATGPSLMVIIVLLALVCGTGFTEAAWYVFRSFLFSLILLGVASAVGVLLGICPGIICGALSSIVTAKFARKAPTARRVKANEVAAAVTWSGLPFATGVVLGYYQLLPRLLALVGW